MSTNNAQEQQIQQNPGRKNRHNVMTHTLQLSSDIVIETTATGILQLYAVQTAI